MVHTEIYPMVGLTLITTQKGVQEPPFTITKIYRKFNWRLFKFERFVTLSFVQDGKLIHVGFPYDMVNKNMNDVVWFIHKKFSTDKDRILKILSGKNGKSITEKVYY